MTRGTDASAELRELDASAWPDYLAAHSGLPGPRANLELVAAVAALADGPVLEMLLASGDEYQAMCGAAAVGSRAGDPRAVARLRGLASDERWRVREGVVIGLQLLGDARPGALASIVRAWADDSDPLVQRAAVAAICEPRLLRTPANAALALEVCELTTSALVALPLERRKRPDVRTLRQALGYCWSVAIAADPSPGLAAFAGLDTSDPDVAWIVDQNRRKKRLSRLLGA